MEEKDNRFELLEVDELISRREEELNTYTETFKAIIDKTSAFMKDYKDKTMDLIQSLNKQMEAIYNALDSFETYYENTEKEIKELEATLLTRESEFEGEEAKELEKQLRSKLQSETDKLKNDVTAIYDSVLVEYKKTAEQLAKAGQRLVKLNNKEILK